MSHILPYERKGLTFLKSFLWPVFPHETKKVLYLSGFIFLVLAINTLIHPFRDALVIMSPNSGAEVIGFLHILGDLPIGILFVLLFSYLNKKHTTTQIISIFYVAFIIFTVLFSFFIHPFKSTLNMDPQVVSGLMKNYPHLKWLFPLVGNWVESVFFVVVDIWLTISLSQFFWQTANHVSTTSEASRFYPIFIIVSGIASILFSFIATYIFESSSSYAYLFDEKIINFSLQVVAILNMGLSLFLIFFYRKLSENLSPSSQRKKIQNQPSQKKDSIFKGFQYLLRSSYLFFIFLTLVSWGIIYQLINFLWKSELKAYVTTANHYNEIMADYSLWSGVFLIIFALITKSFIHKWGWVRVSYITPFVSFLSAIPFFLLFIIHHTQGGDSLFYGMNSHKILALTGAFQSIAMLASIVCLYTPTKEMTYIPLNPEEKVHGKAAVDVFGGNCGVAGAGIIQEGLLSWTGGVDLTIITPLVFFIFGLFGVWFYGTIQLGKKYTALVDSKNAQ